MLLLFDIDGTLLSGASRVHAECLLQALHDVYGLRDPVASDLDAAGRTDLEIARAILLRAGVSASRIDEDLDELEVACCEAYAQRCPPSLSEHVVAGMDGVLASLAARPGVQLAPLTGNLEPVARLKLSRAGLGGYFPSGQGAFGSDSEDRTELPPIARWRAGSDGHRYPRERTIVIGDTPRDIACARADGVRCVAVTSGPYRAEQLGDADWVARDAGELERVLGEAIAGGGG